MLYLTWVFKYSRATQWTRHEYSRLFGNRQKQLYACVFNLVHRRIAEHAEVQGSLLTCRSNLTRCGENHTSLVQWGNLSPKYSSNALWCLLCCPCHFPFCRLSQQTVAIPAPAVNALSGTWRWQPLKPVWAIKPASHHSGNTNAHETAAKMYNLSV